MQKFPHFATLQSNDAVVSAIELASQGCCDGAFRAFLGVVYFGSYQMPDSEPADTRCLTHVHLYVLGERLSIPPLQRVALSALESDLKRHRLAVATVMGLIEIVYAGALDRIVVKVDPDANRVADEGNVVPTVNGQVLNSFAGSVPEPGW